jgi:hypothetical protein
MVAMLDVKRPVVIVLTEREKAGMKMALPLSHLPTHLDPQEVFNVDGYLAVGVPLLLVGSQDVPDGTRKLGSNALKVWLLGPRHDKRQTPGYLT